MNTIEGDKDETDDKIYPWHLHYLSVKDLIKELSKLDGDLPVCFKDLQSGNVNPYHFGLTKERFSRKKIKRIIPSGTIGTELDTDGTGKDPTGTDFIAFDFNFREGRIIEKGYSIYNDKYVRKLEHFKSMINHTIKESERI